MHGTQDRFFGEPQASFPLSVGSAPLPCHFRKVHYTVLLFSCHGDAVQVLLQGKGLEPALGWGNRKLVAIGLIRYTDSDLGAYDEVILSIPCVPATGKKPISNWLDMIGPLSSRITGQHILHIPVTAEFSRMAGNELWGFPKIVTNISHSFHRNNLHSRLEDQQGKLILDCRGSLGFSLPFIPLSLLTYSFRQGLLLLTRVKVRGRMRLFLRQRLRLTIGDSDHPMASDLRRLGLDGRRPLLVLDSDKFQAVFGKGEPLTGLA